MEALLETVAAQGSLFIISDQIQYGKGAMVHLKSYTRPLTHSRVFPHATPRPQVNYSEKFQNKYCQIFLGSPESGLSYFSSLSET